MSGRRRFQLVLGGRVVRLGQRTLIMGVINVTPDSFSDGGLYLGPQQAVARAVELVRQGADWLDVGGESTRPGAQPVPAEEELRRVLPVIRGIRRRLPQVPVSIDTTKSEVAEECLRAGATLINDVSGLNHDPRLAGVARRHGALLVLMHMRGQPATMQRGPFARWVWRDVLAGLDRSIERARAAGVPRSRLIVDPGLGFGKTRRQNYELLAGLARLARLGLPILVGASRKSFVQAVVAGEGLDPARRKTAQRRWPLLQAAARDAESLKLGDAAVLVAAVLHGAHIIRVHDVAAALPAVRIADALLAAFR